MFNLQMALEDTKISAEGDGANWRVTLSDEVTGVTAERTWTNAQLAAVVSCAINGDDDSSNDLAEETIRDLPKEVRPIP